MGAALFSDGSQACFPERHDTPHQRLAVFWGFFLVETYLNRQNLLKKAWSMLKSVAEERFRTEEANFDNTLFNLLPEALYIMIQEHPRLNEEKKTFALVFIPYQFSDEDRKKFEEKLFRIQTLSLLKN